MRAMFAIVFLALTVLFLPAATAHVTVTAQAPAAPIVPGEVVTVPVTFSADCATVLAEYQAVGTTELEIEIKQGPTWISGVGATVSFSADMCDPTSATVESTGDLVLTAGPMAPGLQPFELVVGAKGDESTGTLAGTVAFVGAFTVETPGPEFMLDDGNGTGIFTINYTGNAAGRAMLQVIGEPVFGTIEGLPETLDVPSPLVDNTTSRSVPVEFAYKAKPRANFSMDMVTIQVMMHAADDPNQMGPTQEAMFHFMMMDHEGMEGMDHGDGHVEEHDHSVHEHPTVPGFDAVVVAFVVVGLALLGRRRA